MNRHRRARRRTFILAIAFAIPLLGLLYLQRSYPDLSTLEHYGVVPDQPLIDRDGVSHPRASWNRPVTVIAQAWSPLAAGEKRQLEAATQELARRLDPDSYQLILSGDPKANLSAPWLILGDGGWTPALVDKIAPGRENAILIIDQKRHVRAILGLAGLDLDDATARFSQLAFAQKLSSYLENHTFFGPAKKGLHPPYRSRPTHDTPEA